MERLRRIALFKIFINYKNLRRDVGIKWALAFPFFVKVNNIDIYSQ